MPNLSMSPLEADVQASIESTLQERIENACKEKIEAYWRARGVSVECRVINTEDGPALRSNLRIVCPVRA